MPAMMLGSKVDEILSKKFYVVDVEDTLSSCLGIFREKNARALVVMDGRRKKYVGMLSKRSIIRSLMDPAKTKVKSVYWKAPKLSLGQGINEVARLMVENDLRHLPVFEGENVVGLVSGDDILMRLAATPFGHTKVRNIMTKDPVTLRSDESIGRAISRMRDEGIARLPVVEDDRVVGIVTMHDVVHEIYEPRARMAAVQGKGAGQMVKPLRDPVKSIMVRPVVTIKADDTVATAVRIMVGRDISSLVVAGDGGELQGIITKTDILKQLAQSSQVKPHVRVQITVKDPEGTEQLDRKRLAEAIGSFARRHEKLLANSVISLYIKKHKEQRRGLRLVHCRILVSGPSGQFASVGEGWGPDQAIKTAMGNVERQIVKTKEILESNRYQDRLLSEALGLLY